MDDRALRLAAKDAEAKRSKADIVRQANLILRAYPGDRKKTPFRPGRRSRGRPSELERLELEAALAAAAEAHARRKAEHPVQDDLERFVYVVGCAGHPIKIGMAVDPLGRLKSLQTGFPHRLRIYAQIFAGSDAARVEQECHRRLSEYRLNGEWFDYDPYQAADLVKSILQHSMA